MVWYLIKMTYAADGTANLVRIFRPAASRGVEVLGEEIASGSGHPLSEMTAGDGTVMATTVERSTMGEVGGPKIYLVIKMAMLNINFS